MWSNFFMQEEDRRRAARGRRQKRGLSPEREGKTKLALLLAVMGATLSVLAVGTEFWVELNTYKANGSAVCEAAHLGLWKVCTKRLWQADVPADRDTCGPAELPGGESRPTRGCVLQGWGVTRKLPQRHLSPKGCPAQVSTASSLEPVPTIQLCLHPQRVITLGTAYTPPQHPPP